MNPFIYQPHPCPHCNGTGTDPQRPRGGKCDECRGTGRLREYVIIQLRAQSETFRAAFALYAAERLSAEQLEHIYFQSPSYHEALAAQVRLNREARREWRRTYPKPREPRPPRVCADCGERIIEYKGHVEWQDPELKRDPPRWRCRCAYYWRNGWARLRHPSFFYRMAWRWDDGQG